MGRKQSAYLARLQEEKLVEMNAVKKLWVQYLTDTMAITMNRKGWGAKRIEAFLDDWGKVYDEFYDALLSVPETDYYRAKMDEILKPLNIMEEFKEFEKRYPFLPEVRY